VSDETVTEAQVVADLAKTAALPKALDPEKMYSVVVPDGSEHITLSLEAYLHSPARLRGTTRLHDADSFTDFVRSYEVPASRVYADQENATLCAVFNDATTGNPGWADHRAVLRMKHTPEWLHWADKDGSLLPQASFAEHIEDGLDEIRVPEPAEMLELAQTFHANTGVAFKSSSILSSGERQLVYEESTTTKAGTKGQITVPREIELAIRPYEGSDLYKVVARFRHRASGGDLKLGYRLNRPHDILRSAFNDTVEKVNDLVDCAVLRGTPPEGVGA
jgi:uncharacterized protein YfdQ (DUF2303 family)